MSVASIIGKKNAPNTDLLVAAVWAALALPTLRHIYPRLKPGATLVVDNIDAAKAGYVDFLAFVDDPANGFKSTTIPYAGGLKVIVYVGHKDV